MAYLLLVLVQLAGLLLIPLGLPGLWVQVTALGAFAWLTSFRTVGWIPIALVAGLALVAETAELLLGGRYARRYGGARRSAWGAAIGGLLGAALGTLPIPVLGSVVGALVGAFLGAFAMELTTGRGTAASARVGWGAFIGRTVAVAMKVTVGVVILVLTLLTAAR